MLLLIITKLLWVGMLLLFFAGGVGYAINPQVGRELLKRSLVLLVMLLLIRVVVAR